MKSEIRIEFEPRKDKDDKTYYLCRPSLPATIDLRDCVFFFWPQDVDGPTMAIAMSRPGAPRSGPGGPGFSGPDGRDDNNDRDR